MDRDSETIFYQHPTILALAKKLIKNYFNNPVTTQYVINIFRRHKIQEAVESFAASKKLDYTKCNSKCGYLNDLKMSYTINRNIFYHLSDTYHFTICMHLNNETKKVDCYKIGKIMNTLDLVNEKCKTLNTTYVSFFEKYINILEFYKDVDPKIFPSLIKHIEMFDAVFHMNHRPDLDGLRHIDVRLQRINPYMYQYIMKYVYDQCEEEYSFFFDRCTPYPALRKILNSEEDYYTTRESIINFTLGFSCVMFVAVCGLMNQ